ncbi:acyl-CoA dehydrogenase family protein [Nocardia vaccinii]|uniref:acyl-CoA dehydrogenase family protein n=1 Tax=Nocardia vaccinii TaxID=1822 RepID=UPI00082B5E3B|nr:acyl-CoA dehydrogenase family protein [Nocardia vaccinii]
MIDWSEEQRLIRDSLRRFVQTEIEPHRDELEHGDLAPYDILRKMYTSFGMAELAQERYRRALDPSASSTSDKRRDPTELAAVLLPLVELCRCSPGMVTALGVSTNLTPGAIMKSGSREQIERWVADLVTLRKVGAWALTEPGSGSDAFGGMKSTAVREGDEYVLNGSKTFITNGPHADTIVFICKEAGSGQDGSRPRILSFVLDRGMPGLVQTPPLRKMGMHSSPTGELFVSDVRVGADRLLAGRPDRAKSTSRDGAKGTFASERASIAAMALGIIEKCLEASIEYARTRVQFGHPIGEFQLIQHKLAQMEIARLNVQNMLFRYIESLSTGHGVSLAEASAMKLYSARASVDVAMEAVQIHGGNGYMSEFRVEQLARDAKVLQIYAGTDEIQTIAIAKDLLRVS